MDVMSGRRRRQNRLHVACLEATTGRAVPVAVPTLGQGHHAAKKVFTTEGLFNSRIPRLRDRLLHGLVDYPRDQPHASL